MYHFLVFLSYHYYIYSFSSGEMAEWLKAHAWKVCIR